MAHKKDYILFDHTTQAFIYNMQTNAVQRMLDYSREPISTCRGKNNPGLQTLGFWMILPSQSSFNLYGCGVPPPAYRWPSP